MGLSNWKSNLKRAISGNELKEDLVAGVGAAAPYVLIPTLFGLGDWMGWAVGTGSSWMLGALTGNYRIKSAAIALGFAHLMMSFFKDDIEKVTGKTLWNFTPTTTAINGLAEGYQNYQLPNGEVVRGVPATELPAMNGYYDGPDMGLRGYYNESTPAEIGTFSYGV